MTTKHLLEQSVRHLGESCKCKHLQDSPRCRTLCSSECFVVIDQATTQTQLKIKEAVHIHWEKPSLNQQLFQNNSIYRIHLGVGHFVRASALLS